jgi:hypothetical protein
MLSLLLVTLPGRCISQAKSLLRQRRINAGEFAKLTAPLLNGGAAVAARAESEDEASNGVGRMGAVGEADAHRRGQGVVGDGQHQRSGEVAQHEGSGEGRVRSGGGWLKRIDCWLSEAVSS